VLILSIQVPSTTRVALSLWSTLHAREDEEVGHDTLSPNLHIKIFT
jgi:hypothetical protein